MRCSSLAVACLAFFCTACVDEYNAELPDEDYQLLVVDGSIYSDSVCVFHLTHTVGLNATNSFVPNIPGMHTTFPYVTGAKIAVCGSDGSRFEGMEKYPQGTYEVPVGMLKPNCNYWLSIVTRGGISYESEPASPMDALPLQLSYEQINPSFESQTPVEIFVSTSAAAHSYYVSWRFEEWWEVQTPYQSTYYYDLPKDSFLLLPSPIDHGWGYANNTKKTFVSSEKYVNNSIKNYRLHEVEASSPRISTCYYIRVYQEVISRAEYAYEEARRKQSDEMGGLFTPQPSSLPTNIHCTNADRNVIGFVGVRGRITQAEMYLNKTQVRYYEKREPEVLMPEDVIPDPDMPEFMKKRIYRDLYSQGYRVWDYQPITASCVWISRWCVDCMSSNWGTRQYEKPNFWNPTE